MGLRRVKDRTMPRRLAFKVLTQGRSRLGSGQSFHAWIMARYGRRVGGWLPRATLVFLRTKKPTSILQAAIEVNFTVQLAATTIKMFRVETVMLINNAKPRHYHRHRGDSPRRWLPGTVAGIGTASLRGLRRQREGPPGNRGRLVMLKLGESVYRGEELPIPASGSGQVARTPRSGGSVPPPGRTYVRGGIWNQAGPTGPPRQTRQVGVMVRITRLPAVGVRRNSFPSIFISPKSGQLARAPWSEGSAPLPRRTYGRDGFWNQAGLTGSPRPSRPVGRFPWITAPSEDLPLGGTPPSSRSRQAGWPGQGSGVDQTALDRSRHQGPHRLRLTSKYLLTTPSPRLIQPQPPQQLGWPGSGPALLPLGAQVSAGRRADTSGRSRTGSAEGLEFPAPQVPAQEFLLRNNRNLENRLKQLQDMVRQTEQRLQAKVLERVQEAVEAQRHPLEIKNLSLQVYRHIERLIRSERERRGM